MSSKTPSSAATSGAMRRPAGQTDVKRPPNAFMVYAMEHRKRLSLQNPSISNKDISGLLGQQWKSLSDSVKKGYYDQAKVLDRKHKAKYPGYVYNPREARIRKKLRTSQARKKFPEEFVRQLVRESRGNDDDFVCASVDRNIKRKQNLNRTAEKMELNGPECSQKSIHFPDEVSIRHQREELAIVAPEEYIPNNPNFLPEYQPTTQANEPPMRSTIQRTNGDFETRFGFSGQDNYLQTSESDEWFYFQADYDEGYSSEDSSFQTPFFPAYPTMDHDGQLQWGVESPMDSNWNFWWPPEQSTASSIPLQTWPPAPHFNPNFWWPEQSTAASFPLQTSRPVQKKSSDRSDLPSTAGYPPEQSTATSPALQTWPPAPHFNPNFLWPEQSTAAWLPLQTTRPGQKNSSDRSDLPSTAGEQSTVTSPTLQTWPPAVHFNPNFWWPEQSTAASLPLQTLPLAQKKCSDHSFDWNDPPSEFLRGFRLGNSDQNCPMYHERNSMGEIPSFDGQSASTAGFAKSNLVRNGIGEGIEFDVSDVPEPDGTFPIRSYFVL